MVSSTSPRTRVAELLLDNKAQSTEAFCPLCRDAISAKGTARSMYNGRVAPAPTIVQITAFSYGKFLHSYLYAFCSYIDNSGAAFWQACRECKCFSFCSSCLCHLCSVYGIDANYSIRHYIVECEHAIVGC